MESVPHQVLTTLYLPAIAGSIQPAVSEKESSIELFLKKLMKTPCSCHSFKANRQRKIIFIQARETASRRAESRLTDSGLWYSFQLHIIHMKQLANHAVDMINYIL